MMSPLREETILSYLYGFNGTEVEKKGILYLFYTDHLQYFRGDAVQMTLLKVNTRSSEAIFTYRNTQYFDFAVKRDPDTLWRWSAGKFFLQVIQQKLMLPGEMHTVQESWQIPLSTLPGYYTLEGEDRALDGVKLQLGIEVM